jgi:UDPglucose 6-dehydrogenase
LPLAALLAKNGHLVRGYDVDAILRSAIIDRKFTSNEPNLVEILESCTKNLHIMQSVSEAVADSELVFVIVPTPSLDTGHFTNKYVLEVIEEIGLAIMNHTKIVVDIVSTVMPGSCNGEIKEKLETSSKRKIGANLGLCYNPEFIALGSVIHDMQYPDMHLIGESSPWAGDVVSLALESIVKREVPVMKLNLTEAELVKISVNNFVTMKISFANLLMHCTSTFQEININSITNAIGLDSRIGSKYLKAATPYGGPCFPRDTRALSALFKDLGIDSSLSTATETINNSHLRFIYNRITDKIDKGSIIGVAGLSYKTGTQVVEESPGMLIAEMLISNGYKIKTWDDEGAKLNNSLSSESYEPLETGELLINQSDFLVITRSIKNGDEFFKQLTSSEKPYLDFWGHF